MRERHLPASPTILALPEELVNPVRRTHRQLSEVKDILRAVNSQLLYCSRVQSLSHVYAIPQRQLTRSFFSDSIDRVLLK
jgi:hypothetical protein